PLLAHHPTRLTAFDRNRTQSNTLPWGGPHRRRQDWVSTIDIRRGKALGCHRRRRSGRRAADAPLATASADTETPTATCCTRVVLTSGCRSGRGMWLGPFAEGRSIEQNGESVNLRCGLISGSHNALREWRAEIECGR